MNDNKIVLYRIRRKEDGLYLVTAPSPMPYGDGHWGTSGTFWRTKETIIKHLSELCILRMYCTDKGSVFRKRDRHLGDITKTNFFTVVPHGEPYRIVSNNPEWLNKYEVIETEVTEHGSIYIDARDFIKYERTNQYEKDTKHNTQPTN